MGISDCSYVKLWGKDDSLLSMIFNYIQEKGYDNLEYISEKELLEGQ